MNRIDNTPQFNETASLALGVKNVIVHPRWFNSAGESPGDIALLRLDRDETCDTRLRNISAVNCHLEYVDITSVHFYEDRGQN